MLIFYGDGIAYDRVLEDGVTLAPRAILPWPEEDTGRTDCRRRPYPEPHALNWADTHTSGVQQPGALIGPSGPLGSAAIIARQAVEETP